MDISIVVPVYNKIDVIEQCLALNIKHCSEAKHWIIIDNASDEETKAGLERLKLKAENAGHIFDIITEIENTGVAKAWNKGLSLVNTTYVCILNNDCVLMPGWDVAMKLNQHKYDVFSPFVIEEMILPHFHLHDFLEGKKNWEYISKVNRKRYRDGLFGGVVIFAKREIFNQIGLFDEKFWLSMEDMDYLWRAINKNLKVGVIGEVVAHHRSSSTRSTVKFDHLANHDYFESKWGWNLEKVENSIWHRKIISFNKFLLKKFFILGNLNPLMP